MSTESQIEANRENAKLSTGPKSEAGKAASALNNTRHGLAGAFRVLPAESQSEFDALLATLTDEHQPATFTETTLVEAMAQHHWLRQRSLASNPPATTPLLAKSRTKNSLPSTCATKLPTSAASTKP